MGNNEQMLTGQKVHEKWIKRSIYIWIHILRKNLVKIFTNAYGQAEGGDQAIFLNSCEPKWKRRYWQIQFLNNTCCFFYAMLYTFKGIYVNEKGGTDHMSSMEEHKMENCHTRKSGWMFYLHTRMFCAKFHQNLGKTFLWICHQIGRLAGQIHFKKILSFRPSPAFDLLRC